MKQFVLNAAVSLLVAACGLLAYDRFVFRPSQVIGIVDAEANPRGFFGAERLAVVAALALVAAAVLP